MIADEGRQRASFLPATLFQTAILRSAMVITCPTGERKRDCRNCNGYS